MRWSRSIAILVVGLALAGASGLHVPFSLRRLRSLRATLLADADGEVCHGKQTSCAGTKTLQICADLGAGFVPINTMACPETGTPYCDNGRCVASPPPTTTTTTTTTRRPAPAPTAAPVPSDDECAGRLSFCADCYTQTMCARLGNHVVPVTNTTCPASAPYCVGGTCQPDLPADTECKPLPVPESKFRCYGGGYFPDPANCSTFHLCVAGKAYDYTCPDRLVYDHARALCVPARDKCFVFDCSGRVGRYLLYEPDQSLYALCVSQDSGEALVASCPAGHRLRADDPTDVRCEPFCARVGRTADPDDAAGAAYYECLASSAGSSRDLIGPLRGVCPSGSTFDAASERCRAPPARPHGTTDVIVVPSTTPAPVPVTTPLDY